MNCVNMLMGIIDSSKTLLNINYLTSSFISHLKIPTILDDPLGHLIDAWPDKGNEMTTTLSVSDFVGSRLFGDRLSSELNIICAKFDFKSILEKVFGKDNAFVSFVVELIEEFAVELDRDSNINLANFIGQIGRKMTASNDIDEKNKF